MYEFGARAAEPGLQLVRDIDVRAGRAMPVHLKRGSKAVHGSKGQSWQPLLPFCKRTLPAWLKARGDFVLRREQEPYLFPSRTPGHCYTCQGTGMRKPLRGPKVPCHHCGGNGKRWGLSRYETSALIMPILEKANVEEGYRHPHVLRHSIITHLLDGGVAPTAIQDRVGHRLISTTLGYVKLTKEAVASLQNALGNLYDDEDKS